LKAQFGSLSIDRISSAQQVAHVVREMLLRGDVAPSTKILEVPLAKQLGVSRHTVREAMRLLASEGLVIHNFQRGVAVAELSETDVSELFRARRALESAGLRSWADGAREAADSLANSVVAMRKAARTDDWAATVDADLAFHRAIVANVGSEVLDTFYLNLQTRLRLTRAWAERTHFTSTEVWLLHDAVCAAVHGSRHAKAAALLDQILDSSEQRLILAIRGLRAATGPTPVSKHRVRNLRENRDVIARPRKNRKPIRSGRRRA
jgi:DNA-binding GntR family transcriptional regulator